MILLGNSVDSIPMYFMVNSNISITYAWQFMSINVMDPPYLNRCVLLFVELDNMSCRGNKLLDVKLNIVMNTII